MHHALASRRVLQVMVLLGLGVTAYCVLPRIAVDPESLLLASIRGALTGCVVASTLGRHVGVSEVVLTSGASAALGAAVLAVASIAHYGTGLAGIVSAAVVAFLVFRATHIGQQRLATAACLCVVFGATLVSSGYWTGPVLAVDDGERLTSLTTQPQPQQYVFDGFVYLRTLDLMKDGTPYYTAFTAAVEGQVGLGPNPLPSPLNFREPLLFHLWEVLPGDLPVDLLGWFVAFALIMQLSAWFVARSLAPPGLALIAPVLLLPYLSFFMRHNVWFTMMEIWAVGFVLAGLAFLLRGRWFLSLALLLAGIATRELMILAVPGWLVAWWLWSRPGRRPLWAPPVIVLGPALILGVHWWAAPATGGPGSSSSRWLTGPDLDRFQDALTFAWTPMIGGTALAFAIPIAALTGPLIRHRARDALPLTCLVAFPLLFLACFSSGPAGAYWGAILVPLTIAIAPSILTSVYPLVPAPTLGAHRLELGDGDIGDDQLAGDG